MIKQVYDNRVDEILDNLKNRITKEPFGEDIGPLVDNYNIEVENRIKRVSEELQIPIEKFAPKDSEGIPHMFGVFDFDGHYEEFITQGAKKYAYTKYIKNSKLKETSNILEKGPEKSLVLEITVSNPFKLINFSSKSCL